MENKKIISGLAIFLSIIFGLIYYGIFTYTSSAENAKEVSIYLNQVGIYKQESGIAKMLDILKEKGIEGYTMNVESGKAVICNVSLVEKETKIGQEKLRSNGIGFIAKKIVTKNGLVQAKMKNKQYQAAIEELN